MMNVPTLRQMSGLAMGVFIVCLFGCDNTSTPGTNMSPAGQSKHGFIAFVGAGANDPVWPVLQAGARRSDSPTTGPELRFFTAPSDSPRAQADLLRKLTDPDLRGLCIQVSDPEAVGHALKQLHNRGVPIVSVIKPAPEEARFAHIGLDETAVGHELARCTIETLGPTGGTIMVLHAGSEHPFYRARYMAFSEKIRLAGSITVSGEFDCGADPQEARRIIRERSERYPRLTAWVAMSDWPLHGDYPADELFRSPTRYITFGGMPRHWPLIREGKIPCVVGADYGEVGGRALRLCQSAVRDPAQFRQLIYVPLRRVTPDTIDQYERDWTNWLEGTTSDPGLEK